MIVSLSAARERESGRELQTLAHREEESLGGGRIGALRWVGICVIKSGDVATLQQLLLVSIKGASPDSHSFLILSTKKHPSTLLSCHLNNQPRWRDALEQSHALRGQPSSTSSWCLLRPWRSLAPMPEHRRAAKRPSRAPSLVSIWEPPTLVSVS